MWWSQVVSAIVWLCLSLLLVGVVCLSGCKGSSSANGEAHSSGTHAGAKPSQELTPDEVVRIQVESMRDENGVETVYRFASPNNRRMTGPLDRFTGMMETPSYKPLREATSVSYYEIELDDSIASQVVSTTGEDGEVRFYLFELSLQTEGDFAGCWMTDNVAPSRFRLDPSQRSASTF